ncbi:MAG: hypothetical protein HY216_07635 [Candidatus Rokubacteria bacterium]|nr:hypothetical protein [Candidatus Rokubacteria bacterium]
MDQRLSTTIVWTVPAVTIAAALYETVALVAARITISAFLRGLAESYHPVYLFAGIIVACLFLVALIGAHLPTLIRAAVLGWLFVLGHIFWGFC